MTNTRAPWGKYVTYEYVDLDNKAVYTVPAPGIEIYLATDVDKVMEEVIAFLELYREGDSGLTEQLATNLLTSLRARARTQDDD